MQYEPNIIMQFADNLYAKANWIVLKYTLLGVLIGLFVGYFLMVGTYIHMVSSSLSLAAFFASWIFAGWIGYSIGVEKAFWYKFQAQTALCQMQIEKNTARSP